MGNCQKENDDVLEPGIQNGKVVKVKITNFAWEKDYQGLFDYESGNINSKSIQLTDSSILLKDTNELVPFSVDSNKLSTQNSEKVLFRVLKKPHFFKVCPVYLENEILSMQKLPWLVVKSTPNQAYPIREKDIIKLGKQKIRVRELVQPNENQSAVLQFDNLETKKPIYDDLTYQVNYQQPEKIEEIETKQKLENSIEEEANSVMTDNEQVCRICLQTGENSNPLITPCKCQGSIKYIHLKCLRMWLGKRLNTIKGKHCVTINWQPLSCEMCKSHYRYKIYLDNKKYYTVEIPKPAKPYIVLEVFKKNSSSKIFHFVSLAQKNTVNMGRKKDIDVKISDDISVSRNHASITYDPLTKEFSLKDNRSKFGTLVFIKKSLLIRPHQKGMSFQMGAQVFQFETYRGTQPAGQVDESNEYLNVDEQPLLEENEDEDHESEEEDQQESVEERVPVEGTEIRVRRQNTMLVESNT